MNRKRARYNKKVRLCKDYYLGQCNNPKCDELHIFSQHDNIDEIAKKLSKDNTYKDELEILKINMDILNTRNSYTIKTRYYL